MHVKSLLAVAVALAVTVADCSALPKFHKNVQGANVQTSDTIRSRQKREISAPEPLVEEIRLEEWDNVSEEGIQSLCNILVRKIGGLEDAVTDLNAKLEKVLIGVQNIADRQDVLDMTSETEKTAVNTCGGKAAQKEILLYNKDLGSEYMFVARQLNWTDAAEYCHSRGFDLASIETQKEDDFIREYLNTHLWGMNSYWLSSTNAWFPMCWRHTAPEMSLVSYTNWGRGEPDNKPSEDACVYLYGKYDFRWYDACCVAQKDFICERPLARGEGYTAAIGLTGTTIDQERAMKMCGEEGKGKEQKKKGGKRGKSWNAGDFWKKSNGGYWKDKGFSMFS